MRRPSQGLTAAPGGRLAIGSLLDPKAGDPARGRPPRARGELRKLSTPARLAAGRVCGGARAGAAPASRADAAGSRPPHAGDAPHRLLELGDELGPLDLAAEEHAAVLYVDADATLGEPWVPEGDRLDLVGELGVVELPRCLQSQAVEQPARAPAGLRSGVWGAQTRFGVRQTSDGPTLQVKLSQRKNPTGVASALVAGARRGSRAESEA
jgi:hypothetical protein